VKKGIYLQARLDMGSAKDQSASASLLSKLPAAFAKANPGMRLTIKKQSPPDDQGKVTIEVYIQGEQAPASSFLTLSSRALKKGVAALAKGTARSASAEDKGAVKISVEKIVERENQDENDGVILPPPIKP
jgi:hypothetical protein